MTKRNSSFANLDSAWDLRFDSWSQPISACRPRHSSAAASSSTTAASSRQGLRLPGYHSAHDSHSAAICMDIQHLHPALQCQIRIPLGIERSTITPRQTFTKSKSASHPSFQGGDHRTWLKPSPSADGHRNRSIRYRTEPATGIFLQWHLRSCEGPQVMVHRQWEGIIKARQLLAQILQH